MQAPADLVETYRDLGLKVTPQRFAVFEALFGNPQHPTAEAVYAAVSEQMPSVSLRTVYSVLAELADMAEIHQLDLGTGSARFDPNTDPHHHLVCQRCGKVRDVHLGSSVPVPASNSLVHNGELFTVLGTEVVFRGMCGSCTSKEALTNTHHSGLPPEGHAPSDSPRPFLGEG